MDRSLLVQEAIRKAQEEMKAQRAAATVSEIYNGSLLETEYFKKGSAVWSQIRVDGKVTSENRVYKVKSEKPYTRFAGQYWYLSEEHKKALSAVI
ncbi:hypothetical protein IMSAGC012_00660 [Lachnospiraceae bacterium]|nr:hypothetical protein [bacterium 1XD42-76]NBK05071.1 hypothetical protein [bacterium 1XD42-94]GFI25549.1 hypothetical protein IMSAGC012_00660 [Lachnospiraceae bacterium]